MIIKASFHLIQQREQKFLTRAIFIMVDLMFRLKVLIKPGFIKLGFPLDSKCHDHDTKTKRL